MKRLDGKVIVVTGATGAIGRSLCHGLARRGCRLGLLSRTAEELETLAAKLRPSAAAVSFHPVDLRDRPAVHDALDCARRELGDVDVLIHNAGVGRMTCAWAPDLDEVEEMLQVNYLAGVYAIEAVLPSMLQRRSGQLVTVSSLAALRGMAWTAGYSASKAAFATYLESLRPALRRRGIDVSTCYLGFVRTPMSRALPLHPMLWMLSPEAAGRRILQAVARRRSEAYFPWYDACGARFLRRLPCRLLDLVMGSLGRLTLSGDY